MLACQQLDSDMPVEKVCKQCEAAFTVPNRRSDEVHFCSRACKTAAGRITLTCAACSNVFERVRNAYKGGAAYCSQACNFAVRKGSVHQVKPEAPRYTKVCEQCSSEFRITKTRETTARFCSLKCQSESPAWAKECSDRQRGEKHWRYQGGAYKVGTPYEIFWRPASKESIGVHRVLFAAHMAKNAPGHDFLVLKNGEVRLHKSIHVHHIDRNPKNNALSNLLAVTIGAHAKIHHSNRKPSPWECWPPNPAKW